MYKMCDLITDSLDVAICRLRVWNDQWDLRRAASKSWQTISHEDD